MWWFLLLALPVAGLLLFYMARRLTTPKFVVGLAREILTEIIRAALPFFKNKPKTPKEWKEYRYILSVKPSERTPTERERLREILDL